MAVYGIGSMYGRNIERKSEFLASHCACIGWKKEEAPALHQMLGKIKVGDFIYIKSFAVIKKELRVKAVGIVISDEREKDNLGEGVIVKWLWDCRDTPAVIDITDEVYKNNVFNNTLYEEYNSSIQKRILELGLERRNIEVSISEILPPKGKSI
ncbi:hypothetical protein [Priestia megaterium]|uniref:Uncharacterized protein n=1 Tax=Priestia megaterium TaxID=1404 RepID=A0A6M6ECT8_PRIMG|nr:hypothetical protein [Priestia megaterium]QJX81285.1 hypothetical protein FDZ14_34850 [Priestia megaterium]